MMRPTPCWGGPASRVDRVAVVLVLLTCSVSAAGGRDALRFSFTCDMRQYAGPGAYDTSQYFRGACEGIAFVGPGSFMVSPGDIDPPANVLWTIQQVLGTGYPWYPGVGNHEAETPADMTWLRAFNPGGYSLPGVVNAGPAGTEETSYSFDVGDCHIVQLNEYFDGVSDVGTTGDVVDELYDWLELDLQANLLPHVIVMGHEPAWPQPDMDNGRMRHLGDSLDQYPANRDRFWQLLREYDVAAYLCGHTHNTSAVILDGVWQIDAGHSRGLGDTGVRSTFVMIDQSDDEITYEIYRDDAAGGLYSLRESGWATCADCEVYLFQDGRFPDISYTGTRDTYIDSGPVHGSDTPLVVDGDPDAATLLSWDVSAIPAGSTVLRAWIGLNVNNSSADTYGVYELLRDWEEAAADWYGCTATESWEVPGAEGSTDRGSIDLGELAASFQGRYMISLNPDGLDLVQSWIDGGPNRGVILTDYSRFDSIRFDAREYGVPEWRPQLTVQVQLPATPEVPTTGPGGFLLLLGSMGWLLARCPRLGTRR